MKDKFEEIIKKVKEKLPEYMEKAKKIAYKVAVVIKEKAPVYAEKAKKVMEKIKKEAPVYMNKAKDFCKKNPKQVVVGIVILLVAIILILASVPSKKKTEITQLKTPTQQFDVKKADDEIAEKEYEIYFNFTAVANNDFNYQIFYTVKDEIWYDPEHVVSFVGSAGENTYKIKIPAQKVYRIRLDFDAINEEVTVSNMYLSGDQEADLNNFKDYLFNDIAKKTINKDGSLTVLTKKQDPHIGYYIK